MGSDTHNEMEKQQAQHATMRRIDTKDAARSACTAVHVAAAVSRSIITWMAWATNPLDAAARASAGDRESKVSEQGVRWASRAGWECASVTISISRKAEGGDVVALIREKMLGLYGGRTGHGGDG
jgi:hypothetical protein